MLEQLIVVDSEKLLDGRMALLKVEYVMVCKYVAEEHLKTIEDENLQLAFGRAFSNKSPMGFLYIACYSRGTTRVSTNSLRNVLAKVLCSTTGVSAAPSTGVDVSG